MGSNTAFEVCGRTVVITGGSRGMGLAVAHQLAAKGANVVIVARDQAKLVDGLAHIQSGALHPDQQRFHQISADLSSASEAVRVVDEVVAWNGGSPPDVMWCCAGSSHPTLFIDTPISEFATQMNNNYFSSLYMAHAIVKRWLQPSVKKPGSPSTGSSEKSSGAAPLPRHLIFTASFMSFYSFAGYASYSPAKAALRSLSDTLSSEMNLYSAAHPREPRVRLHTIFPAGILSEGYEAENRVKSDLTKHLEEGDKPETPEVIAARSIKGMESGLELITTDFQTGLVRCGMLGGSVRGGFLKGLGDWFLAGIVAIVMVLVRGDHDKKVRNWGIKYGTSGSRGDNTSA